MKLYLHIGIIPSKKEQVMSHLELLLSEGLIDVIAETPDNARDIMIEANGHRKYIEKLESEIKKLDGVAVPTSAYAISIKAKRGKA